MDRVLGEREPTVSGNGATEEDGLDAITEQVKANSLLDDKRYQSCQERFDAYDQEIARLKQQIIQTRAMIGERELRFEEFLRRLRGISEAFVEGIDELVREW